MENITEEIQKSLFELQDLKYRDFQCSLMPTVPREKVIGVRTPLLRKMAGKFAKDPEIHLFLDALPHKYYEENNLHAFILETVSDYGEAVELTEAFLPYVDNWATGDSMNPKVFKKHKPELMEKIRQWLTSGEIYTIRFGIRMLMSLFLDGDFTPECAELVAAVKSEEYYVNMMRAWYFATALVKQWDNAMLYIENCALDTWTHNKTIQKACESYRITDEQKKHLRSLKIKA